MKGPTTHVSKYMILQLTTMLTPKNIVVVLEKDKPTTIKKK